MALSLKQRITFHRRRSRTKDINIEASSFSVGYVSGQNLFADDWQPEERKKVVKDAFKNVTSLSKKKRLSINEIEELNRKKGLLSYVGDLRKEKLKKGLSLYDKRLNK